MRFGQGHHIRHWAHGGPTTLSNLTLLCRRHHRAVHEEGFQVDRQPDGTLQFRRPVGSRTLGSCAYSAGRRSARGLSIHPRSSCPGWLGERLDVRWGSMCCIHALSWSPPTSGKAD
ncbi:MAG TPA: HNH endonuclease signature motif containing protein [Methylomirabilota bacterium]|nr:HNH endonuclease signature motif containing protein [Methylomirabilota bacterium]